MEAQHKVAARSAQLLAKDSVRAGGAKALSTITTTEAQLHQVCAMFANLLYSFYLKNLIMKMNSNHRHYKSIINMIKASGNMT